MEYRSVIKKKIIALADFDLHPGTRRGNPLKNSLFFEYILISHYHFSSIRECCTDTRITLGYKENYKVFYFSFQKSLPAFSSFVRNISADKTLKEVLAEKIPQEQENVKAFRKSHGSVKVGEVTVDMVSAKTIHIFGFIEKGKKGKPIVAPCAVHISRQA